MITIIGSIVVAIVLLWGGALGLMKLVENLERKHLLGLAGYATLVAGLVMALVLLTIEERQKQHQSDMQVQIRKVTQELNKLSSSLLAQLEEKAQLTGSEFQFRANLQNEQANHDRTKKILAARDQEYRKLDTGLKAFKLTQQRYETAQNSRFDSSQSRARQRFEGLQQNLGVQRRLIDGMQKKLSTVQVDLSKTKAKLDALQKQQNSTLGKVNQTQKIQDQTLGKVDRLARALAALHDDLNRTSSSIDSLYKWQKD